MIAYAGDAAHIAKAKEVVGKLEAVILFPLMTLLTSVALLVFLWGMYEYVAHADDETARATGKLHMLYGIIGMLVIISAYGILKIAAMTIGCDVTTMSGCGTI